MKIMRLHFKSPGTKPGVYPIARHGEHLKHLSFTIVELGGALRAHTFETGEDEVSLDFYTGPMRVTVESAGGSRSFEVAKRSSVADNHVMIWAPRDAKVKLEALDGEARATIGGAKATKSGDPVMVCGVAKEIGKDSFTRTVYTHIADNVPAERLICGETVNRPGCWSSCPPHKHDVYRKDPAGGPGEVPMEEIYYFQLEPQQGFGFMRVYTDPSDPQAFDHSFAVEHGDTVLIPRGYHPVVACPGYKLHYTWILAGEGRAYGAWTDDPKHAWIRG